MNFNQITVGIVTFKSEKVIFKCLKSIKKIKKIIIFDNSNDIKLKKKIKKNYPRIKFILSKNNLGYGVANNKIIKIAKTPYIFILNPDTYLKQNCEIELVKSLELIKKDFSILAPFGDKNFGFLKKKLYQTNTPHNREFEVDYVRGFALLINKKKFQNIGMFDKNFFLYLEDIDLCKRLRLGNQKIFVSKNSKVTHIGAKSSNIGIDYEKCRNWHWMWSKVYFRKKFSNIIIVYLEFLPILLNNFFKILIYTLVFNQNKKMINNMRFLGILNALLGKNSWFRPNI